MARLALDIPGAAAELGRFLPASVLLSSGLLKHLLPEYNSTELFSLANPYLYSGFCVFEVVLGLCLLFRALSGMEACLALGTFLAFSGIQIFYASTGKHSCGCLGSLSVDARWMAALDLVLSGLLVVYLRMSPPRIGARRVVLILIAASVPLYSFVERYALDGKDSVRAVLSGSAYYAAPAQIDLGVMEPESKKTGRVTVHNRTDRPIRIVGLTELPIMQVGDDVPMAIPPGAAGSFHILLTARGEEGRNVKSFLIWCEDNGRLTTISAYLSWTVSRG